MPRKRNIVILLQLLIILASGSPVPSGAADRNAIFEAKDRYTEPGAAIAFISEHFIGTPYRANTLGGGADLPERLTVRLDAVDCFTLLDYVEAIRRSISYDALYPALAHVRYRGSQIDWASRRHFFTDWAVDHLVDDVTGLVGRDATRRVSKRLNEAGNGGRLLPGVAVRERIIHYIPSAAIDYELLTRLQTGDYIGIYSQQPGLDVSHVGILIREENRFLFRHASSRPEVAAVVDEDVTGYLQDKAGIIVLRARPL